MDSDRKPQGLHLRPHKGTYLGSLYLSDSDNQKYNSYKTPTTIKTKYNMLKYWFSLTGSLKAYT